MYKTIFIIEDDPMSCLTFFDRLLDHFVVSKKAVNIVFIVIQQAEKRVVFDTAMSLMQAKYTEAEFSYKDGKGKVDIADYFTFSKNDNYFVEINDNPYVNSTDNIVNNVAAIVNKTNGASILLDVVLVTAGKIDEERLFSVTNPQPILSHYLYCNEYIHQHSTIYTTFVSKINIVRKWTQVLGDHFGDSSRPKIYYRNDIDGSDGTNYSFFENLYSK